jgi:predicted ester cyclase
MASAGTQTLRARRESVVNAHIQAEAVQGLLHRLLGAFPDFWLQKLDLHHADDAVIVEAKFGGTHRGPWAGIGPTGKQMEAQSALVFVFDSDKLVCEKVYFDHATILSQLSAHP